MNVGYAKEDLIVGDQLRSVVVDHGREALSGVLLRANDSRGAVDRVPNEGEQAFDRLTQLPVDRRTALQVEHPGDCVAQYDNIERMHVRAEARALERERIGVEILCPPPLVCRFELGDLMPGADGVTA